MISVIVPVYNVEQYLDKCVESIVNQTYKDLEIILVDDGSPDNCPAMCDKWAKKDSRIKVIHKKNGGLSSARNAGLDIAEGDYITFVDSDDTIDLVMYDTMFNLFDKNVDMVMCGHQKIDVGTAPQKCIVDNVDAVMLEEDAIAEEIFGNLNNSSCNKIYRMSTLAKLRFQYGIFHGEDLIFNLQFIKNCKAVVKCNYNFYHYYTRNGSITRSDFNSNKFKEIESKDIALEIIKENFPNQINNAKKYCFRARMNVIRSIYMAGKESEYNNQLSDLQQYVKENYRCVKSCLSRKEIAEYLLLFYCKPLYLLLNKLIKKL